MNKPLRLITIVILLLNLHEWGNAKLFGLLTRDDYQLLKSEIESVETNFNDSLVDIKASLRAQIAAQADLNAQLGVMNTTLTNKVTAGRDATSVVNDTNIYKYGAIVLSISVLGNLILFTLVVVFNNKKKSTETNMRDMLTSIKYDPLLVKKE